MLIDNKLIKFNSQRQEAVNRGVYVFFKKSINLLSALPPFLKVTIVKARNKVVPSIRNF